MGAVSEGVCDVGGTVRPVGRGEEDLHGVDPLVGGEDGAAQALFASVGCASCHTPSMNTGPDPVAAHSNRTAHLYSDLLLHDLGSLNDGIAQGDAGPNEMKTPPLWGVRAKTVFLHDGRAATLDAAILDHAGEGEAARQAYSKLDLLQRKELIAFHRTL